MAARESKIGPKTISFCHPCHHQQQLSDETGGLSRVFEHA
jgi:hypothetical protein